jgi:hypothetical protein
MRKVDVRKKIKKYYDEKINGQIKRSCEVRNNFIKQPSKKLLDQEVMTAKKNTISQFTTHLNETTTDIKKITDSIYCFYEDLLGKDRTKSDSFDFKLKKIDIDQKYPNLSKDISYNEAYECIKGMKDSAPGPNGLTINFYKKFFFLFGNHLLEIFNNHEMDLNETFKESTIKLIPKNNKNLKTINDLRPISLTNFEYRIFTKIIVNRLNSINNEIIKSFSQTCSIKNRRMDDSVNLLRDIIQNSKLGKNEGVLLVSVDQRKAFDSISHKYLFSLIKHLNLGDFLYNNITRLYKGSWTKIEINGSQTKRIDVKTGIKQGCALSMFLYIVAIQECLLQIDDDENIQGYEITVNKKGQFKSVAYADDIVGILKNQKSIEFFFKCFENWGHDSGASINKDKTKILNITKDQIRPEYKEYICEEMKVLGVIFDKTGIAEANFNITLEKMNKSINIWKLVSTSFIERVTIIKTFLLGRFFFIAKFYKFKENQIKIIKKNVFSFLWNNKKVESLKRETLYLDHKKGGLKVYDIERKFKTIRIQQLLHSINNIDQDFHIHVTYWLKNILHRHKLIVFDNYNIINCGTEKDIPEFYKEIKENLTEILNEIKRLNLQNEIIVTRLNSKTIYQLLQNNTHKPSVESKYDNINWEVTYSNNLSKFVNNRQKEINYLALHDALAPELKFDFFHKNCELCDNQINTTQHLFINCQVSKRIFNWLKCKEKKKNMVLTHEKVFLLGVMEENEIKIYSIYKQMVWETRNILKYKKINPYEHSKKIYFKYHKK